jgi:hypothetical protein
MFLLEQTAHSLARLRQRGLRETDACLIAALGTEVRPGMFMITNQDADSLIKEIVTFSGIQNAVYQMSPTELKRRIDRLRGCVAIADGPTLITMFHKTTPTLRTDPRRDPRCRRRRQRRDAEWRKRSFHFDFICASGRS